MPGQTVRQPTSPSVPAGEPRGDRRRIGRILLSRGLVNLYQLAHAVSVQRSERRRSGSRTEPRLGQVLLRLGYVKPMDLVRALCDQAGMVNFLVLGCYLVEPPLVRLVPRELAHRWGALPLVSLDGVSCLFAVSSPPRPVVLRRLERRLRQPVEPILVQESALHAAIDRCYEFLERRGTFPVRLGEILVRDGLVGEGELAEALAEARRVGRHLGEVLLRRRVLDEHLLYRILARQRGLRLVSAREVADPHQAARLAGKLPKPYLLHQQVLPYRRVGGTVLALTSDPNIDTQPLAEALRCRTVRCQLVRPSELVDLIERTCRLAAG